MMNRHTSAVLQPNFGQPSFQSKMDHDLIQSIKDTQCALQRKIDRLEAMNKKPAAIGTTWIIKFCQIGKAWITKFFQFFQFIFQSIFQFIFQLIGQCVAMVKRCVKFVCDNFLLIAFVLLIWTQLTTQPTIAHETVFDKLIRSYRHLVHDAHYTLDATLRDVQYMWRKFVIDDLYW